MSRSAIDAGRMLASSDSDRRYSDSIAASARAVSRSAYQTVATTRTHAAIVLTMNAISKAHSGWVPVLWGTEQLERDHGTRAKHGHERGQPDAVDAEHQYGDGCRDEEVEVQAARASDVVVEAVITAYATT